VVVAVWGRSSFACAFACFCEDVVHLAFVSMNKGTRPTASPQPTRTLVRLKQLLLCLLPPLPNHPSNMTDMYDEKKVPEFALPPYQHEDHGASVSRQDGSAANVGCVKKCQEDSGARALNSSGCSR
jgi:hypothetical protein